MKYEFVPKGIPVDNISVFNPMKVIYEKHVDSSELSEGDNLLELLDATLERQLSVLRINNTKMDLDISPKISRNKEHIKKHRNKLKENRRIRANEVENANFNDANISVESLDGKCKEQCTTVISQIDIDDNKRRKELKKQKLKHEPESGKSIVSFLTEKIKELENETFEHKGTKRKMQKSETGATDRTKLEYRTKSSPVSEKKKADKLSTSTKRAHDDCKINNSPEIELKNTNNLISNNNNVQKHKKRKKYINQISDNEQLSEDGIEVGRKKKIKQNNVTAKENFTNKDIINSSYNDDLQHYSNTSFETSSKEKKKADKLSTSTKRARDEWKINNSPEIGLKNTNNLISDNNVQKHKRRKKYINQSSDNEQLSEDGIEVGRKKKIKQNNITANENFTNQGIINSSYTDVLQHYSNTSFETSSKSEEIFTPDCLILNYVSEKKKADKLSTSTKRARDDCKINNSPEIELKNTNNLISDNNNVQKHKKRKKYSNQSSDNEQLSDDGIEVDRKNKIKQNNVTAKENLTNKDIINSSYNDDLQHYSNTSFETSSKSEEIFTPESLILNYVSEKKKADKLSTSTKRAHDDCKINNSPEIEHVFKKSPHFDSDLESTLADESSHSKPIVVGSEQTELTFSATGVSILSHVDENGVLEESTSEIYAALFTDDFHPVNNNENDSIETNNYDQTINSSDDSMQLTKDIPIITKRTDPSVKKKHRTTKKRLFKDDDFDNNSEASNHKTVQQQPLSVIKQKKKSRSKVERSVEESQDIDWPSLDYSDFDGIKDALDISQQKHQIKDEDLYALENLYIAVPWVVPLAHTIETRMSSVPTKPQQEQFKRYNIKFRTGPYSKIEDDTIKANWKEFCQLHSLNRDPKPFFNFMVGKKVILSKAERVKFVQYLGRGLEDRMLYSIYIRFRKLFRTINKGVYGVEEDRIIQTYTQNSKTPNRFSELATLLNRDRNSVIKRYQILSSQQVTTWNMKLTRKLIEELIDITNSNTVDDLEHAKIHEEYWNVIIKRLKLCTSPSKVEQQWCNSIHPGLFNHENRKTSKIKKKLINILYDDDETDQEAVNWNHLAQDFKYCTGDTLCKIFSDMVVKNVPKHIHGDFRASISYLKNECSHIYEQGPGYRNLKYSDGELYLC